MNTRFEVDLVILGGGVAGLWLLNRLQQQGYSALLMEAAALGAGQTRFSQGIIHGGTKYALTGKLTGSSEAIVEMPGRWRDCLNGTGEIDLSGVRLLCDHQFLWSTQTLTSRMAGFFASRMMRSRTQPLDKSAWPAVFRNEAFKGQLYKLEEPVLDTASLVEELARPVQSRILPLADLKLDPEQPNTLHWQGKSIRCQRLVLMAGAGNEALLRALGQSRPQMQRRPLKMVMVRGQALSSDVYAHCLGASANPRITISSHSDGWGQNVWYLGGQLAEEGIRREDAAQIAEAKKELQELLPWVAFDECEWATLNIDRAEPRMADGTRPSDIFAESHKGLITAWPTKLAMAPRLADRILTMLEQADLQPGRQGELPQAEPVPQAPLPWQEEARWN